MNSKQSVKTTTESIICPECGKVQKAKVKHTMPFDTYIHECKKCKYIIMESEWERVEETKYITKLWQQKNIKKIGI